jgi:uncharacterized repeat protein (TIGR01451 family)
LYSIQDKPPQGSISVTGLGITNMVVNINLTFNPQIGRLECRLSALDTNTGFFPVDALTGFLPPENGTGRGQGHLRFTVKPKAPTPIGTGITNVASIVFDGNDAINTPEVWNIIGDVPPLASMIEYLPGEIRVGTPFTYTIGLTNTGTNVVSNVALTDTLFAGASVVNATATLGTVVITNGWVIWTLGDLVGGDGASLTVTALPTEAGTFTNGIMFSGGSGLAIFSNPSAITVANDDPGPSLSIHQVNGHVELSWPTNTAGFVLESSANLSVTSSWLTVTSTVEVVNGRFTVTNSISDATRFYRLKK